MATILLLDDDRSFRAFAAQALAPLGHTLVEATRAADARRLLSTQRFELLIVDALLPDSSGPDFLRAHRKALGNEPALLVSAFWKTSLDAVARDAFAQAALPKPVDRDKLLRCVGKLLPQAPAAAVLVDESIAELEVMRARYAQELPALVDGLSVALTQLRARPQQPGLLGVARRRAHQIAGLAGSFGFAAAGDACAAIEDALVALQRGASTAWADIDRVLAQLSQQSRAA